MPIDSSSAPLRDLVNQYGANSPQVTRIIAAVNASPYLESMWNSFATRTAPGGRTPVIRVDPLDDSGRGNAIPCSWDGFLQAKTLGYTALPKQDRQGC